jgi:hypothetical protein
MWRIYKDGKNIASFSDRGQAFAYGIAKGIFVKDLRKLNSGWWIANYELKEDTGE